MRYLVLALIIASLLIFGCSAPAGPSGPGTGGGASGGAGTGGGIPAMGAGNSTGTGGVGGASGGAGTGTGGAGGASGGSSGGAGTGTGGSALDQFTNLIGMKSQLQYKATYNIRTTGEQAFSSTMTQYVKGSKFRIDSSTQGQASSIFYIDSKVYMCSKPTGAWMCFEFPNTSNQSLEDQTSEMVKDNPENYAITPLLPRTIAGTLATCFQAVITGENAGTVEFCFSPEGVPLYTHTVASGTEYTMEATSYTTSISDSDFSLPATPQAFPTGG